MSVIRETIRFTGRVQGVGFRATTVRVARDFSVAGWVRNEPDGSVLCVAEGADDELQRFRDAIHRSMQGFIADIHVHRSIAEHAFNGFEVAY
ncbi:MAG TPA: acylphosphatase [Phycisphaerales bacterium]|nr:acylphosphatase [Phycisphaerales bacterium]